MSHHPNHSVAVSVATQTDSNGDGRENLVIPSLNKNAWLAVKSTLKKIWSPLAYDVADTVKGIRNWNNDEDPNQRHVMRSLIDLVSHLILCMIMTILLPINLPWKQIKRGSSLPLKQIKRGSSLPRKQIKRGRFTLTFKWLRLAISCIAISLDLLFLYIPFIDEKNKCLGMNKTLRTAALAMRSLTDLALAFHTVALIHDLIDFVPPDPDTSPNMNHNDHAFECIIRKRRLSKDIIIHFTSILPIPQVTIIIVFFRMRGSAAIVNFFLLLQFIVRGCQIYNFQRQVRMLGKGTSIAFYVLMYILAANVLGASWYFLSIQREISCWHQTYRNITGCVATNYCEDTSSSTCANIKLLNKFCPINPSNATLYNFGIFLGALEFGNAGPKNFWKKYFYTLWWGIRNLSNFGTNLETSNYVWEICFAITISLAGLLLFIYLMGNVQTYILWESQRALKDQEEKVKDKYRALKSWLTIHGISEKTKTQVEEIIKQNKVVERKHGDVAVDLFFVFNAIKEDNNKKWQFWTCLCEKALKKVTILQHRSIHDLGDILNVLDPVCYAKDEYVVRKGELDNKMLIITKGIITCSPHSTEKKSRFEKGEVYGQELLSINFNETRSKSDQDVKCQSKVEAFALTVDKLKLENIADFLEEAKKAYEELTTTESNKMNHIEEGISEWLSRNGVPGDLQTSVKNHIKANRHVLKEDLDAEVDLKYLFSIRLPVDIEWDIKEHFCMSILSKVPVLKSVGEDMLHHICLSLEPVILTQNNNVFKPGDEIDQMLIIVNGEIVLIERTIGHGQREQPNVKRVNKGDFFGEKVLMSAFPYTSISNSRPAISHEYVECCTKVEAFALTKESATTFTKGLSRSITIINQKLDSLIQLQSDMFQQQGQRLDKMAEFLDRLG